MGKIAGGDSWVGILAAVGLAAVVGGLVALPALRLRGLYLALATLAFGQAMDYGFFQNANVFGQGDALTIGRPTLFGMSLQSNRTFLVFISAVFAIVAVVILGFRRSRYGRRVIALASSPSASVTLGMKPTITRLGIFMASAGLAGLAGALYAQQQLIVGPGDFQLLASLTLLLLAVVWGVRTTSGMLFAGLLFAIFPVIETHVPALRDLLYLGTGLAAIGIGRNPNGAFGGNTPAQKWRDRRVARASGGSNQVEVLGEQVEQPSEIHA
jgi:branched-chain amino acid transport system permease protein